jgi:hypothetical protein
MRRDTPCFNALLHFQSKLGFIGLTVAFLIVLILAAVGVPRQWAKYDLTSTTAGASSTSTLTVFVLDKGKAESCGGGVCNTFLFNDINDRNGDKDKVLKGATAAYALAILLAIFGGLALVTSFVLLLRELGTINAPGKILMLLTVVFGWLAVAVGFGSLIGYGTGVHPPFKDATIFGSECGRPKYCALVSFYTFAKPLCHAAPAAGTTNSVTFSWVDGFALVLTSLLVAFVASIGAVLLLVKGAGGGEPKATPAPASAV